MFSVELNLVLLFGKLNKMLPAWNMITIKRKVFVKFSENGSDNGNWECAGYMRQDFRFFGYPAAAHRIFDKKLFIFSIYETGLDRPPFNM